MSKKRLSKQLFQDDDMDENEDIVKVTIVDISNKVKFTTELSSDAKVEYLRNLLMEFRNDFSHYHMMFRLDDKSIKLADGKRLKNYLQGLEKKNGKYHLELGFIFSHTPTPEWNRQTRGLQRYQNDSDSDEEGMPIFSRLDFSSPDNSVRRSRARRSRSVDRTNPIQIQSQLDFSSPVNNVDLQMNPAEIHPDYVDNTGNVNSEERNNVRRNLFAETTPSPRSRSRSRSRNSPSSSTRRRNNLRGGKKTRKNKNKRKTRKTRKNV